MSNNIYSYFNFEFSDGSKTNIAGFCSFNKKKIETPVRKVHVWTNNDGLLQGIQMFDIENKMILQTDYKCF